MKTKRLVKFKLECGHSITMDAQHARHSKRLKFGCYRCRAMGTDEDRKVIS